MDQPPLTFLDDDDTDDLPLANGDGSASAFVIDEDDRYSRLRLIPWWRQELLSKAKVLVVGAGALGKRGLKEPRADRHRHRLRD